jgi:hypothetical protein
MFVARNSALYIIQRLRIEFSIGTTDFGERRRRFVGQEAPQEVCRARNVSRSVSESQVGADVRVDSETFLTTDFVNLKIKLVQSFEYDYISRVCIRLS